MGPPTTRSTAPSTVPARTAETRRGGIARELRTGTRTAGLHLGRGCATVDVNVNIHPSESRLAVVLDAVLHFLNQPIGGAAHHVIEDAHKWHARLMVLGWGVLIPTGIVVARYFKVLRRQDWPRQLDNRIWWRTHLALQISGCLLSFVAVWIAFRAPAAAGSGLLPFAAVGVHETLGWSIVILGIAQILGGAVRGSKGDHVVVLDRAVAVALARAVPGHRDGHRGGDHYLMTVRRCMFEYVHKMAGYVALALAGTNILLGLAISDAFVWMWLLIVGYWLVLAGASLVLQRQGRCVDTYQAIYGPDISLPGNARLPIGWGVRRYAAGQWPPARPATTRQGRTA